MAIFFLFLLGIGNFAMHKAVLESGHPILMTVPWFRLLRGQASLGIEFVVLVGSMLMVAQGAQGWAWGYMAYSGINSLSAWLILSGKV